MSIEKGYSICFNEWALDTRIKNELNLLLIISSLTAEQGYCFANNKYFADLFRIDEISVSRKIKKLENLGYISIDYTKRGCEVVDRKIRLTKMLIHDLQKNQSTINKNVKDNNINNNIKENNIKEKFSPPTLEEVIEYFKTRNLTESSAKRFFDYYTAGCWKDGKGDKIKNWKQKAIAVWDKPENREKTPEDIKILEKREEESIIQNYWLKNCSLLNSKRRPNLILVNISNMLDKLKDKDDFAHKVVQTMVKQILTEEQIEKVLNYIESRI